MRHKLAILWCLTLVFAIACGEKEKAAKQIAEDLKDRGTMDLLKQTSEDEYTAPEDGRLSEAQVEIYLKVRDHEKEIAKVAKKELEAQGKKVEASGEKSLAGMMAGLQSLGSVADILTADIRAAKDLGYNTAEYQWIKGKVLEASGSVMTQKLQDASSAMMDTAHSQLKQQYDEATDEATKKALGDMLAQYEQGKKEMEANQEQEDPSVAYNRQLLSKYENALNALAVEYSKFEDTEGETENAMKKWEQDLDKQVQAAKTDGSEN